MFFFQYFCTKVRYNNVLCLLFISYLLLNQPYDITCSDTCISSHKLDLNFHQFNCFDCFLYRLNAEILSFNSQPKMSNLNDQNQRYKTVLQVTFCKYFIYYYHYMLYQYCAYSCFICSCFICSLISLNFVYLNNSGNICHIYQISLSAYPFLRNIMSVIGNIIRLTMRYRSDCAEMRVLIVYLVANVSARCGQLSHGIISITSSPIETAITSYHKLSLGLLKN